MERVRRTEAWSRLCRCDVRVLIWMLNIMVRLALTQGWGGLQEQMADICVDNVTKVKLVVSTSSPAGASGGKVEGGRKDSGIQMCKCAAPRTHQALLDSRPGQSRPQLPMSRHPAGPVQWTRWRSCCWTQSPPSSHSYWLTVFSSHLQPKDSTYTYLHDLRIWQVSFSFFGHIR